MFGATGKISEWICNNTNFSLWVAILDAIRANSDTDNPQLTHLNKNKVSIKWANYFFLRESKSVCFVLK